MTAEPTADRLASIRARADAAKGDFATRMLRMSNDAAEAKFGVRPPGPESLGDGSEDVPFLLDLLAAAEKERDEAQAKLKNDETFEAGLEAQKENVAGLESDLAAAEAKLAQAPHEPWCRSVVIPDPILYVPGFRHSCTCWKAASPVSALDDVRAEAWELARYDEAVERLLNSRYVDEPQVMAIFAYADGEMTKAEMEKVID